MNASLPNNIEQIEVYRDILPDNLVEETLARQKHVQNNKKDSLQSVQIMKSDCNVMAISLGDLKNRLKTGASSLGQLERSSKKCADAFFELSAHLREMAKNLQTQSKLLKKNN